MSTEFPSTIFNVFSLYSIIFHFSYSKIFAHKIGYYICFLFRKCDSFINNYFLFTCFKIFYLVNYYFLLNIEPSRLFPEFFILKTTFDKFSKIITKIQVLGRQLSLSFTNLQDTRSQSFINYIINLNR